MKTLLPQEMQSLNGYFDTEYLLESQPVLEEWLEKALSLEETEEIIHNLLLLELTLRKLHNCPLDCGN